jgi:putative Holliday junction resolvase
VIAFDFGARRIGIALGNTLTCSARPLTTIDSRDDAARWSAIAAVIAEWQPARLIVGLPMHADGKPHAMTAQARRFAAELAARFAIPVALADERWTSEVAQSELRAQGRGGRDQRALRDQVAAQLILQAWLNERDDVRDS